MLENYGTSGKKIIFDSGVSGEGLFSAEILLDDKKSMEEFKNILTESDRREDGIFKYNAITFKVDYIDISILLKELESYLKNINVVELKK